MAAREAGAHLCWHPKIPIITHWGHAAQGYVEVFYNLKYTSRKQANTQVKITIDLLTDSHKDTALYLALKFLSQYVRI